MTKKNFLKFNADWINESMKKKNICFAFLKISRRVIDGNLNIKMIVYIVYHCLQNDKKIFKKSETEIWNDISKFYKDFALLSYFSVKFNAKLFNFDQRFLTTMKTSIFFAIKDVIIDCRIWNFSMMQMKLNQLFSRNTSRFFIKKIKANILKIMFKFLNVIKQIEKWCFEIKLF